MFGYFGHFQLVEEKMDNHKNLMMPGNPRYQPIELVPFFGYDNLYREVASVEIAVLEVLAEREFISPTEISSLTHEVKEALRDITTTEVDRIEESVHHDIRAWISKAHKITPNTLKRWVHLSLTSWDVLDTARVLQFRAAYECALKPSIVTVVNDFISLIERFSDCVQIGRTHGQHAIPITVGFWLANILHRITTNWEKMDTTCSNLQGKISGAVGAHNAQIAFGFTNPKEGKTFEERVLEKLGLKPAPISSQILSPEPLANFLFACVTMSAALGQFGRDCRHLMRSEIGELFESRSPGQKGSSAMPHKHNPKSFENLEGTWLRTKSEFGKVMNYLISEHQRDLVGSSLARDFPIILINLQQQLNTLTKNNSHGTSFLRRIVIDEGACDINFRRNEHLISSEAMWIALQIAGYQEAYELVNDTLVPLAMKEGTPLIEILEEYASNLPHLKEAVALIAPKTMELLRDPEHYIGDAKERSLKIAQNARQIVNNLTQSRRRP